MSDLERTVKARLRIADVSGGFSSGMYWIEPPQMHVSKPLRVVYRYFTRIIG